MSEAQFEIRMDVPLPPKQSGGKAGVSKYPFADLQVGESFVVGPDAKVAIRSALTAFRKKHPGLGFATRVVNDGVGIWRIK